MDKWFQSIVAAGGALASYLFGGWSALLGILITFVIIDYVSGFIAAGIEGNLNSSRGMKGIAKKVAVFFVVAVAHMMDIALGYDSHILRDATIFFFLANEALSILENVGRMGVSIPPVLQKAIDVLNEKGKGEEK